MNTQLERFQKKKRLHKNAVKRYVKIYDAAMTKMAEFVESATVVGPDTDFPSDYQRHLWESYDISRGLNISSLYLERCFEQSFIVNQRLNKNALCVALDNFYYSQCLSSFTMIIGPKRFPKAGWASRGLDEHFILSMALLAEQQDKLDNLYRMLKVTYEAKAVIRSNGHIADLVLALIAVSKGEKLNALVDKFAYQNILDNWNTQDIGQVTKWLTTICDDQMMQVNAKHSDFYTEFNNGFWQFIPYAALTLLKLRENAGLPNPDFTHELFPVPSSELLILDTTEPTTEVSIKSDVSQERASKKETPKKKTSNQNLVAQDLRIQKAIAHITQLGFSVEHVLEMCD